MAAVWGTSKSWTSHFTAPAMSTNASSKANGHTTNEQKPIVFRERARTTSRCSTTSSKWSSKTRPRTRGIVYELEPVPIDPNIDPDWDLCFNCWKPDHSHKECTYPKYYEYCRNCGRRGVNWTTCPRCAKGYINYQRWRVDNNRPEYRDWREKPVVSKKGVENKSKEIRHLMSTPTHKHPPYGNASENIQKDLLMDKSFPPINGAKPSVLSPPSSAGGTNAKVSPIKPNGKIYARTITNIVIENEHANQLMQNGMQTKSNSLGESLVSSEEGDYDDEDLDGIIFDDEETNLPEQTMSSTTQDFISLIDLVKHLSIETQNKVVEDFLQQCRLVMDKQ